MLKKRIHVCNFGKYRKLDECKQKKQREKLLELKRRLAEDDKEGVMAHKNLAHKDDVPTDIMDQALNAHIKILDYSCSQALKSLADAGISGVDDGNENGI